MGGSDRRAGDRRAELLAYYCERMNTPPEGSFGEALKLCAMQRLMQALGAYGFLGLVKEQQAFLAYIPVAMASLKIVIKDIPGLQELQSALPNAG